MVRDPHILTSFLYENPQAWPVRMALIEEMVRDGDMARAKALIRESPEDSPMPPEYPMRIHALMTKGVEGLESLPPLVGFRPRSDLEDQPSKEENRTGGSPEGITASPESTTGNALVEVDPARNGNSKSEPGKEIRTVPPSSGHQHSEPSFDFEERTGEVSEDGELIIGGSSLKGGLGALVESQPIRRKRAPQPPAPGIDRKLAAIRWENYAGKTPPHRRRTSRNRRIEIPGSGPLLRLQCRGDLSRPRSPPRQLCRFQRPPASASPVDRHPSRQERGGRPRDPSPHQACRDRALRRLDAGGQRNDLHLGFGLLPARRGGHHDTRCHRDDRRHCRNRRRNEASRGIFTNSRT